MPRKRVLLKSEPRSRKSGVQKFYQNPLTLLFAPLLAERRGRRELAEVANELGISTSTYRLIEAGAAALPAYCTWKVSRASHFDWNRLSRLVAAMHALEKEIESL